MPVSAESSATVVDSSSESTPINEGGQSKKARKKEDKEVKKAEKKEEQRAEKEQKRLAKKAQQEERRTQKLLKQEEEQAAVDAATAKASEEIEAARAAGQRAAAGPAFLVRAGDPREMTGPQNGGTLSVEILTCTNLLAADRGKTCVVSADATVDINWLFCLQACLSDCYF